MLSSALLLPTGTVYTSILSLTCQLLAVKTVKPPIPAVLPLCVDLDGTLIACDTTFAALRVFIRRQYWQTPRLLLWLLRGRAYLKQQLALRVTLDVARLPYNDAVLQLIKACKAQGNPVYLVTASDAQIAQRITAHLAGLFTACYASDGVRNLRHRAKAEHLCKTFGVRRFVYVGNSRDDLAVWQQAHSAIIVSNNPRLIRAAHRLGNVAQVLSPEMSSARSR